MLNLQGERITSVAQCVSAQGVRREPSMLVCGWGCGVRVREGTCWRTSD
jgi:hypothetical protein